MPTIFAHAAVAAVATLLHPARSRRLYLGAMACAVIPDLDVIGIPGVDWFGDAFAHRGVTHSLAFAALFALAMTAVFFRQATRRSLFATPSRREASPLHTRSGIFLLLFVVTASHGVLDALTTGGPGVAFFAPFHDGRYFFPWRPIAVSPLGVGFFSARGVQVALSEVMWIGLPLALVYAAQRFLQRRK